jgi:hypothetical protein
VRPAFRVVITFNDQPLPGATIEIHGNGKSPIDLKTNGAGAAQITALPAGEYWLSAGFLGMSAAYECFHVAERPTRTARAKLNFTWGEDAPATQQLAGKLIDLQPGKDGNLIWRLTHKFEVPIVGASLKLQDPICGATYFQTSDDRGEFQFGSLPSGTYVLHIEGGKAGDRDYDATDQLVALDVRANRRRLVFMRREGAAGSCGGTELELRDP